MKSNQITTGSRVKGPLGSLVPNPRGHNRRVREVITGTVISSVGHNQWLVKFDIDGKEIICSSRSLTSIAHDEGVPVNEVSVEGRNSIHNTSEAEDEPLLNDHEVASEDGEVLPNGDWDLADEMLGFLDSAESDRHQNNFEKAWDEIRGLEGKEVTINSDRVTTVWTVVGEVDEDEDEDGDGNSERYAGLNDESYCSNGKLLQLFMDLWPGDLFEQLNNLNLHLVELNQYRKKTLRRRPIKDVTRKELVTFIALIIAASSSPLRGYNLWSPPSHVLNKTVSYGKFMKEYRFKEIKSVFPMLFWDKENKADDPWWKFRKAVDEFNETRKKMVNVSSYLVMDESMSSIVPRTT